MPIINDKIIVDFIPVIENGDAKKIHDSGIIKFNEIILSIFNQLMMQRGTLEDYPEIGCFESLLKIHFSESQSQAIAEIRENISKFKKEQVSIDFDRDSYDEKMVNISLTVSGIPGLKFTADLIKENNYIKIVNPKVLEV